MTVTAQYQDRYEAGEFLADKLRHHAGDPDLLVLALPRGGVPVGYEVAAALEAPLDVFLVRKLGVPGYEELAMGAVASGGVKILNDDVIRQVGIPGNMIDAIVQEKERELGQQEKIFRGERPSVDIKGRTVILVDDGLATGASMRAAVKAVKSKGPKSVIVAVPIGSSDSCQQLQTEVDEVFCAMTPDPFYAVGAWYSDFMQITDEEVRELLDHAAHERRARQVQSHRNHTTV
ncbi:MAG: putative phosphoribosyltransferase [Pedosphaera sp.]|nr:putative phosphoribosyltransferase [Pedosphaera sp.]